jgi:hypothetical protein
MTPISEASLLFLHGRTAEKPPMQLAAEIGEIIGAGLACAELLELEAESRPSPREDLREAARNFQNAASTFFLP